MSNSQTSAVKQVRNIVGSLYERTAYERSAATIFFKGSQAAWVTVFKRLSSATGQVPVVDCGHYVFQLGSAIIRLKEYNAGRNNYLDIIA